MAKLSAEQIRNQFGFSYNENHAKNTGNYSEHGGRDDGAIYSTEDGTYIGTIDNFTPRDGKQDAKGIGSYKAVQDYELENGYKGNARKNWDSMNDVAGAVNNIYGINETPAPVEKPEPKPVVLSDTAAKAKAYTSAYEDVMLPRQGDYTVLGDESVITDFGTEYDLQLKRAQRPQTEENMAITEEEDRKNFAKNYANDYKKAVADTLQPSNRDIF